MFGRNRSNSFGEEVESEASGWQFDLEVGVVVVEIVLVVGSAGHPLAPSQTRGPCRRGTLYI